MICDDIVETARMTIVPSETISFHMEFHVILCEIPCEDIFAKSALMIFGSDLYAFRTSSGASWSGDEFHLEFQVILCDSK